MTKRVALITGGMGGLGETVSTKMADAGYKVVVTYSPANTTADKWLAQMTHAVRSWRHQRDAIRSLDSTP